MQKGEPSDYAAWMQLANDPSQTEEARQIYRARMEGFVRARLVNAFQFAAGTAQRPSSSLDAEYEP